MFEVIFVQAKANIGIITIEDQVSLKTWLHGAPESANSFWMNGKKTRSANKGASFWFPIFGLIVDQLECHYPFIKSKLSTFYLIRCVIVGCHVD